MCLHLRQDQLLKVWAEAKAWLQGVKKAARGNYSCRVGNGVPTYAHVVESEPIFLDVKCELS